ncbi:MAG TPA: aldo/keto reductase [Bacteroidales bacterium]|nr:aldo/keto reductase [Bacteroidales bacterium]
MADRRTFIKILSGAAAGTLLPLPVFGRMDEGVSDRWGELLPRREFGATGEKVTMMGVGGFHIGKQSDYEAQKTIETAIEGGIRYFDTAADYQHGGSEQKLGRLLVPKYRDEIFLHTKTRAVTAEQAQQHLEDSLMRLNTDHLDLWLMHSVNSEEDADNRIDNGVLDVFQKAKAEGKTRHIGFSGHVTPVAHLKMLQIAPDLEACMLPVNLVDPSYNSFIKNVIPELQDANMGIIAMKTLAGGGFFGGGFEGNAHLNKRVIDYITVKEAIQFSLSMPVSVLVTGPDNSTMMKEKIGYAQSFHGMDEATAKTLIDKVAKFANTKVEYYKM